MAENGIIGLTVNNTAPSAPAIGYNKIWTDGSRNIHVTDGNGLETSTSTIVPVNSLINGGFDFAQRQAPATLTTIITDKYSADRWRNSSQSGSFQYARVDALGESGLSSQYYGQFKQITNAGKFMVYQIIEGVNSVDKRGQQVIFSIKMKASSAKTIKMGIIELQTSGSIDTIPTTFVTSWNANSTDPTLGANLAVISGSQAQSVTTSWTKYNITITIPTTSKNIICAIWSDSQFSANDILYVAEAGLYIGTNAPAWQPRPVGQELALCQRYYRKSYDIDVSPSTAIGNGSIDIVFGSNTTSLLGGYAQYPLTRSAPTIHFYDFAGAIDKCYRGANGKSVNISYIGQAGFSFVSSDTTSANELGGHYVAEADL